MDNQQKNIELYSKRYENVNVDGILKKIRNVKNFLDDVTTTDTSWVGLYTNDFRNKVCGKKVLEMGCGDCTNAAVLAALGAEVYANDIANTSGLVVDKLNAAFPFAKPIKFISGDFLKVDFPEGDFDFVLGKAFLHHLTEPVEKKFLIKIATLLKKNGEARFFEPAVNSKVLDEIRWYFPVPGRPSKFNKRIFKNWKEHDPHPDRNNSSKHYRLVGEEFFREVEIIPLGSLERFHRILPAKFDHRKFRRKAFIIEQKIPAKLNEIFARSQTIIYKGLKD